MYGMYTSLNIVFAIIQIVLAITAIKMSFRTWHYASLASKDLVMSLEINTVVSGPAKEVSDINITTIKYDLLYSLILLKRKMLF